MNVVNIGHRLLLAAIEEELGRDPRIDRPAKVVLPRKNANTRTTVEIPAEVLRRLREECAR
jgi:hypothetical protein